jgi:acyl transferase domain-containing protein
LQVGREAMEVRLACVVSTIDELKTKLAQYLAGDENVEGLHRGDVKRDKDALPVFSTDVALRDAIEKWVGSGELQTLGKLWAKGLTVDWSRLYGEPLLQRVSLPTYPFAKERYWVPRGSSHSMPEAQPPLQPLPMTHDAVKPVQQRLHPLLHRNTSSQAERRFWEGLCK